MSVNATEDLAAFVERMGGDKALKVEESLGEGFVRLRVSEAERRQAAQDIRCSEDIVIEMLRNARDADAHTIFVATSREGKQRSITMLDDGTGIPQHLWETVFDARVTSKLESVHEDLWGIHGRGMALYSIKQNALDARVMDSARGGGSSLRVVTDTESLPEKTDQSSWPVMGRDDEGALVIERGPHNIIRACCAFALAERTTCEVYLGSSAEIAATIRYRVTPRLSGAEAMYIDDLAALPVLERFGLASDARELAEVSCGVGLDLSERTAQRIIAGQIRPLTSVYRRLVPVSERKRETTIDLTRDQRGLRISQDDSQEFLQRVERDFAYLADRYYLNLTQKPRMRVSGQRICVYFEFEDDG